MFENLFKKTKADPSEKLSTNHLRTLLVLLMFCACVTLIWTSSQFYKKHKMASAAKAETQQCLLIVDKIIQARTKPSFAVVDPQSTAKITEQIEFSLKESGIPVGNLIRVDPRPPKRIGKSCYKKQYTHLELHNATLPSLVRFLHILSDTDLKLNISELKLRTPRRDDKTINEKEFWQTELVLTQLIFSP